ncbi:MAG: acyl-CoA dehydrogenase family protein [Burkholderiaceae bacterium]
MDFTYTSEQQMLRDSLGKLLAQAYGFDARQKYVRSSESRCDAVWQQFGRMGLLALPFAQEHGGMGGSFSDLVAIGELLGQYLVVEPYVSSILLGGSAMALGASADADALGDVVAGEVEVALAHEEAHGIGPLGQMTCTLRAVDDGLRLDGTKLLVLGGPHARTLIVSARHGDRLALVRVDPAAPGVAVTGYRTIDGRHAATVRFDDVRVQATGVLLDDAEDPLEQVLRRAVLFLCAEATGAMHALLGASTDYAATRKQFGVPISSFQVVAHRLADMKIAYSKARALLLYTTALLEAGQGGARDVSLLKAQVSRLGRIVGESAVQVHGGIGMTDELSIGHYLKRILAIEAMFGNTDYHLRRVGAGRAS